MISIFLKLFVYIFLNIYQDPETFFECALKMNTKKPVALTVAVVQQEIKRALKHFILSNHIDLDVITSGRL